MPNNNALPSYCAAQRCRSYSTDGTYSSTTFSVIVTPRACSKKQKHTTAIIVGSVVGGVVFLALIVVIIGVVLVWKFPHTAAKVRVAQRVWICCSYLVFVQFGFRSRQARGAIVGGSVRRQADF